ncbi:MAG: hypothetical protein K2X01_09105 [Cyanobacteria bacterium]|nr:hypothetical protein [Cyanobacteriota bacterium]
MSSPPELTPPKSDLLVKSALVVLLFLILIWPLLSLPWMHNDFLMLQFLHLSHPSISLPISVNWPVVWQQFSQPFMGDVLAYRPLSTAFFAAFGQLTQFNPSIFHILNLFIHLANTALMYRLLGQLGFGHLRLLACGLFLIHPVHVEALSWVLGGLDIWGSFWILSALSCYCSFRSISENSRAENKRLWLIGFWASFILGLLIKEITLVLPFLLYWIESRGTKDRQPQKSFQWVLLSFLAFIPYFFLTQPFLKNHDLSWFQLDYFAKPVLFLPMIQLLVGMNQEALIEQAGLAGWNLFLIVWLLGLAGLGGGVYVFLKTPSAAKSALFGMGAYILCLVIPSLPLLQGLDPMTMLNSRFLYLASIPFCALLAGCLQFMPKHLYRYCLIGVFLVGTWVHAHAWQQAGSQESAFLETLLQRYGNNFETPLKQPLAKPHLDFLSSWPSVDQGAYILLQGFPEALHYWPHQAEVSCTKLSCEPTPSETASIHWIGSDRKLMSTSELQQHYAKTLPVQFVTANISNSASGENSTVLPAIFASSQNPVLAESEQKPNTSDLLEVSLKGNERHSNHTVGIDRNAKLTVSWPVGFSMWMSKTLFHLPMDGKPHTLYLPLGNHKSWSALSVLPPVFVSVPSDVTVQSMTLRRKS